MRPFRILVINGPNLNLVGLRQPEIYGRRPLKDYLSELSGSLPPEISLRVFGSNCEGEIIDAIQAARYGEDNQRADAIVINAGAYSHYSLAIADALRSAELPAIEVHISNIYSREPERRKSVISECCRGVIAGLGLEGYGLAVRALAGDLIGKE